MLAQLLRNALLDARRERERLLAGGRGLREEARVVEHRRVLDARLELEVLFAGFDGELEGVQGGCDRAFAPARQAGAQEREPGTIARVRDRTERQRGEPRGGALALAVLLFTRGE
ncbi:MAG TPA: hypothetical protein VIL20_01885, partial [Sandaracinaceae bacterium]